MARLASIEFVAAFEPYVHVRRALGKQWGSTGYDNKRARHRDR